MLAFRALQIGLKYSYQNWRMWSNYAMVAVDLAENTEACRALTRVVEERADIDGEACLDIEVIDRLVASVTRAPSPGSAEEKAQEEQNERDGVEVAFTSNSGKGLETYVSRLLEQAILPRMSSSARIYQAHAKLLLWRGRVADALDAHVKAYRASVVNDELVERERVRWREAVDEVCEVVDMLVGLGPRAVDDEQARLAERTPAEGEETKLVWKDWKFQARSIVRSFMGASSLLARRFARLARSLTLLSPSPQAARRTRLRTSPSGTGSRRRSRRSRMHDRPSRPNDTLPDRLSASLLSSVCESEARVRPCEPAFIGRRRPRRAKLRSAAAAAAASGRRGSSWRSTLAPSSPTSSSSAKRQACPLRPPLARRRHR